METIVDPDQMASSEATWSDLDLHCFPKVIYQDLAL